MSQQISNPKISLEKAFIQMDYIDKRRISIGKFSQIFEIGFDIFIHLDLSGTCSRAGTESLQIC